MRESRKSTQIVITICIALMLVQCQPETSEQLVPTPTESIKGHELYSWQVDNAWYFALVVGTNRVKTFAEISSAEQQLSGLEALKSALDQLPQGAQLFWSASRVPETVLPPAELINEISGYCAKHGLVLQLDPVVDMPAAAETPPAEGPAPRLTPTPPVGGWVGYQNPVFAVILQYPPHWQVDAGYSTPQLGDTKYAGDDGFFIIGAMDGVDLDTVTASTAHHKLQPFGAEPRIEHLTIQGQPARLISPSDDQPLGMEGYSELIIQYPQPVPVDGYPCRFFTLTADRDHILPIAQTLQFSAVSTPLGNERPATPVPAEQNPEILPPAIHWFEVSPNDRLDLGDTVTVRWSTSGAMQRLICYRYAVRTNSGPAQEIREEGGECFGGIPAECHMRDADGNYLYSADDEKCKFLPAEGEQQVVLSPFDEGEIYYVRFWIQAMSGTPDPENRYGLRAPITEEVAQFFVPVTCTYQWFMSNPPQWCPAAPPQSTEAIAQNFENGVMVYLPADGPAPNTVHAFYFDAGQLRQATMYNVSPVEPDPTLAPLAGLQVPNAQFYPVWDGAFAQTSLRAIMGWASDEPFPFTWISQYEQGPDSYDAHYVKMPDGSVYQHNQMEHVWTRWE